MFGKIVVLVILIVFLFVAGSWLGNGGWAEIKAQATTYSNPLGDFWEQQKGKPVSYSAENLAPAVPSIGSGEYISSTNGAANQKDFGDPSPSRGQVTFVPSYIYNSGESSVSGEDVTVRATYGNTAPIDITGWSLASAVSGARVAIPQGTTLYRLGAIAAPGHIYLSPGAYATINSGSSPLGVSFRSNACTGYLNQFQTFIPSLENSCPSPASEMPLSADTLRTYGAECVDYVAGLPSCTYHIGSFPSTVSETCRTFVTNALSYNGCVEKHQFDADFAGSTWRIYLGSGTELWNNTHDVIRLLDSSGRTVDVWTY